ncbi:YaiI/YqxD family protein [Siminovitchia sediminis]|uniref:UPF0178 protein ACFSCZ_01540 n=1 Tax=Siminovitchia sediminis TaxID=1274353 RepID=A0ABW4KGY2_9BACI
MIFVDADACPVKNEISLIGKKYSIQVTFVASYNHKPSVIQDEDHWIFVDPDSEACDIYILNHIYEGDIIVTQDIGLASLALRKGVYVFSPRGTKYREETIDTALDFRYLAARNRRLGKYGKGPKPFTAEDRDRFQKAFDNFCRILVNEEEKI